MTRLTAGFPGPSAAVRCAVSSAAGIEPTAYGQMRLDRRFAHAREKTAGPPAGSSA